MNSVKFNGKDLPKFVKLVGREISVLPDLDVRYHELPRQIGGSFLYTKQGVKKESLDFTLIPEKLSNVDAAATEFAQWLRGNDFKPSKIVFADKPDRYSMAQVNGSVSVSDLFLYGSVSVEFLYVDPLSYLNTPLEVNADGNSFFEYKGDAPQYPVISFTISIDVDNVFIYISNKNPAALKAISLNGTFKSGDKFVIDTHKKQVLLNGKVNMKILSIGSEWHYLIKGENAVQVFTMKEMNGIVANVKSKVAVY